MSSETNTNEQQSAEQAEGTAAGSEELSVEQLRQMLADEQKKSAEYLDNWQRSRADFSNLKRRTEIERSNFAIEAREKLLVRILPIVDDFERALQHVPENLSNEPWISGVTMIDKKFKTLLDQENVAEIPALGEEFDPHVHQAVQRDEESTGDKDVVTEVYQKGYKLGDKVIRPAVVKVGRQ